VLCSAAGTASAASTLATLGTCTLPANALHAGDGIELRFTVEHTGTGTGFEVEAFWGTTVLLDRTASSLDSAVAVSAAAAIGASTADVNVQSWGSVLPLQSGISPVALQAPVVITLKGRLVNAISSDSVRLTNYTVLRYPSR
jgi:hypothetical protein